MIEFEVDNLINMNAALQKFLDYLESKNVDGDDIFDSRLVSCELITNVIRHCGETAHFSGEVKGDDIIIAVASTCSSGVQVNTQLPDVFAESGRGLYIVNAICRGNIKSQDNKIVVKIKIKCK